MRLRRTPRALNPLGDIHPRDKQPFRLAISMKPMARPLLIVTSVLLTVGLVSFLVVVVSSHGSSELRGAFTDRAVTEPCQDTLRSMLADLGPVSFSFPPVVRRPRFDERTDIFEVQSSAYSPRPDGDTVWQAFSCRLRHLGGDPADATNWEVLFVQLGPSG